MSFIIFLLHVQVIQVEKAFYWKIYFSFTFWNAEFWRHWSKICIRWVQQKGPMPAELNTDLSLFMTIFVLRVIPNWCRLSLLPWSSCSSNILNQLEYLLHYPYITEFKSVLLRRIWLVFCFLFFFSMIKQLHSILSLTESIVSTHFHIWNIF